jgi:hypothetical protein
MRAEQGAGSRRPGPSPRQAVAGLLAVAALAYGGTRLVDGRTADGRAHHPAAGVPRLDGRSGFTVPGVFRVTDFDWIGDRLYLVDGRAALLVALERDGGDGWRERFRVDRPGAGPGELQMPISVAAHANGTITVLDGDRLQRFSSHGIGLDARPLGAPCRAHRGVVAALGERTYVAATCVDGAPGSDTVSAVLWQVEADRLRELARAPRFTLDASWGSAFTTERVLAAGADRVLFGSGLDACVWTVRNGEAEASRRCAVATERFVADAPAELRALEALPASRRGRAWQWQRTLPWFHDLAAAPSGDVLLRLWSADSMVLRPAAASDRAERDLLVAPFNGLVGCRAGGCLWRSADALAGVRLVALEAAAIERLLAQGGRP